MKRALRIARLAGRVGRNALVDWRFGRPLAGAYLRDKAKSNTDYRILESIFGGRIRDAEVLVDVGCGAGRVINYWLRIGSNGPIYGLESDASMAAATRRRLRRWSNVTIVTGDAVDNLPPTGTMFYLFNPFDETTVHRFANRVLELSPSPDHGIVILYYNCKHLDVFRGNERFDIEVIGPDSVTGEIVQELAIIRIRSADREDRTGTAR